MENAVNTQMTNRQRKKVHVKVPVVESQHSLNMKNRRKKKLFDINKLIQNDE